MPEVQNVFSEYGDAYESGHPMTIQQRKAFHALREIESSLSPRLKAVYQAMLQLAGDGAGRTTYTELARIWGVSYPQIIKDRQKIEKMIRDRIGNLPK